MAEMNPPNIEKIVCVFREIVQGKIVYNETNLHYEYFEKAGDTIPFKTYGYQSLREFIEFNAAEYLYFGECGQNVVYIAPRHKNEQLSDWVEVEPLDAIKRADLMSKLSHDLVESKSATHINPSTVFNWGEAKPATFISAAELKCAISTSLHSNVLSNFNLSGICKIENNTSAPESDKKSAKKSLKFVSENMHFSAPQSTGLCNPFQNVRNDIRVSVDVHANTRAIGHLADMDVEMTSTDGSSGDTKTAAGQMYFPWTDRYWHLKVTHVVSMSEIWARLYDEFEASV